MIEDIIKEQSWDVRFEVVFPHILKRLEQLKAKTLLHFGCGPGVLLHLAQPVVKGKLYGYDLSPEIRALARKNVPAAEIVDDPKKIPPNSCDAATLNAVWMQF